MRKVIEANRQAGQAAIEATRETFTRAGAAVENIRDRVSANGARAAGTTARKARSSTRTNA
jgi:hypothetical protein